jgi:hypothetical protein
MVERRTIRRWGYAAVALLGAAAIMLLPELLGRASHTPAGGVAPDELPRIVVGITWAIIFGLLSFLSSDEYVRERSKFAWYWGSFFGLAVSAPVLAFVGMGGLRGFGGLVATDPAVLRAMATGFAMPLAAQMIGFIVVRIWWKATK